MTNNSINCNRPAEVACGGTGVATVTTGALLLGAGTSALTELGPLTKGDLLVGDGSGAPTELSVGTDGFVVVADSTEASGVKWVNANTLSSGGALIYLASATASDSSTIEFNSTYLTSTYSHYLLSIRGLDSDTNGDELRMRVSNDNGSTFETSNYKSYNGSGTGTSHMKLSKGGSQDMGIPPDDGFYNAQIHLYQPSESGTWTGYLCECYYHTDSLSATTIVSAAGSYQVTETVNAIEVYMKTGLVATGEFNLYGYRES